MDDASVVRESPSQDNEDERPEMTESYSNTPTLLAEVGGFSLVQLRVHAGKLVLIAALCFRCAFDV